MCGICGCGAKDTRHSHAHVHEHHQHGHEHHHHEHDHEHHHHDHEREHHHHDHEHAHRIVRVERDILEKNDRFAAINRKLFAATKTLALNLVSSPGAGKTTLLVHTLQALGARGVSLAVVEGDQQTSIDADRIKATGVPAFQINTGKMCHLDASMVGEAVSQIPVPEHGVLFIENVGNLVCPAGFDLGEAGKVVLVSVTEGEDKPLKYPDMFYAARVVLITKVDLLPHIDFDIDALERNIRRVNPKAEIVRVSARTGNGLDAWCDWIERHR